MGEMSETRRGQPDHPAAEVEFTVRDTRYPFVGASRAEECRFELAKMVPRHDDRFAEFFNVKGADPDRIMELVAARETAEASLLRDGGDTDLFEFVVSRDCPAVSLAELGAVPREIRSVDGVGEIIAEIPRRYDTSTVIETFLTEIPDSELVSKRAKDSISPFLTESALEQVVSTRLTDRQEEVLSTAFEAGYYDWPRECTGEDVAEELGITSATLSEHLHTAERRLLTVLFEDPQ